MPIRAPRPTRRSRASARLIYPAEAKDLSDFDVISNLPPGAAFRGPGGPPMAFAVEQAIDEAALRLKVDPIALRKRWDPDPNRQRLYDWAAGLDVWRNRKPQAERPLSPRHRGGDRLLALSLAAQGEGSRSRSRAAASSPVPPRRTSAPAPAACSPTRSRASSISNLPTSTCGSAIPRCPKGSARRRLPRHRLRCCRRRLQAVRS